MFATLNTFNNKYKRYDIYDFIACCFVGMGFIFFEERTLYLDSAYLLFNILDQTTFVIEHHRYSAFIPQIPAVFAAKIGMSIGTVSLLLSFGYLFFHFIVYWFTKHKLNQKTLAIVYLMCLLLGMHESFFDMVTETKLALGFAVLYAAFILTNEMGNQTKFIGVCILLILGVFSHPVFVLFFLIVNLFYGIFKKRLPWQHFIILGLLLLVKSFWFGSSSYEVGFYEKLEDIKTFNTSFLHEFMQGYLLKYYRLILIVVYVMCLNLYKLNLKIALAVYLSAIAGVYFLLAIVNAAGESHMMIQKTLYILSFTCLFPIVFFYKKWTAKTILNIIIPLVLFAAMYTINNNSLKYQQRNETLITQLKVLSSIGNKLLIKQQQINSATLMGTWALPYETSIISAWKLNNSMVLKNVENEEIKIDETRFLHTFAPFEDMDKLNLRYFKFSKTEKYKMVDSTYVLK